MQREPIIIVNSIAAAIEAVILAGVAFGLEVTVEQLGAISVAVVAVGQAVATVIGRGRVFAPSTVEEVAANVAEGRDAGFLGN